jgi:hypothetical protein
MNLKICQEEVLSADAIATWTVPVPGRKNRQKIQVVRPDSVRWRNGCSIDMILHKTCREGQSSQSNSAFFPGFLH